MENQIARAIVNGPVFAMEGPLLKLKSVADLLYCAGLSDAPVEADRLSGAGDILRDIAHEFEDLKEQAENMIGEDAAGTKKLIKS